MVTKLTGILTDIFPVETTPNFSKRVFWLKQPDTERYPQWWKVELHGKDVDRLKGIQVGDRLECEVEVRGYQFTNRSGEKIVAISLKCTGITVLERLTTKSTPVGSYKPKEQRKGARGTEDDQQEKLF